MESASSPITEPRQVIIFDTTLRDGDQAGGWFSAEQKLSIAHGLDELGADVIEAGFPGLPERQKVDTVAIPMIASAVRRPIICALSLAKQESIEAAARSVEHANRPRIHVYKASSPKHRRHVFHNQSEQEYLDDIARHITMARQYVDDVEFSPEDATNTNRDFLLRIGAVAYEAGATTFNVPDTYGIATPDELRALFAALYRGIAPVRDGTLTLSTHNHNDYGLATINSLYALLGMGNARKQVEATVNGMGDRAGNAPLEEVVMTAYYRKEKFPNFHMDHIDENRRKQFAKISKKVGEESGQPVSRFKPFVGEGPRSVGTGSHEHARREMGEAYQSGIAHDVGHESLVIELTGSSGKATVQSFAESLGYRIPEDQFRDFADHVLAFANSKCGSNERRVTPEEFHALVYRYFGIGMPVDNSGEKQFLHTRKNGYWEMKLTMNVRDEEQKWTGRSAEGQGVFQGVVEILREKLGKDFQVVHEWQEQTDSAQGERSSSTFCVKIRVGEKEYIGMAEHNDISESSIRALLDAVNKAKLASLLPEQQSATSVGAPERVE
ncbi:MAG: alpha-isopropylmalate synthase regulatory domain-containing protein [Candidatus Peribacteraceae bacterium]|jgi:2-isopropylmalate synthase|nr:alpha-isopropylmalate synthase regulatory domain-containing protein [Candidatus Peribacteraceae bacterium]